MKNLTLRLFHTIAKVKLTPLYWVWTTLTNHPYLDWIFTSFLLIRQMALTVHVKPILTHIPFLVAPAAESRAERLIFSVWRLYGCVLACLLVDRKVNFKYCHQVAYKADFKYWQQRALHAGATQCWQAFLVKATFQQYTDSMSVSVGVNKALLPYYMTLRICMTVFPVDLGLILHDDSINNVMIPDSVTQSSSEQTGLNSIENSLKFALALCNGSLHSMSVQIEFKRFFLRFIITWSVEWHLTHRSQTCCSSNFNSYLN